MKTIDEIEKLSLEDLEKISLDESIPVPGNLESNLRSLWSDKFTGRSKGRWFSNTASRVIGIAASFLIIAGIGFAWLNRSKPLEDTFDDPAVAYAMLENTLMRFSDSVEISVKSVEKSRDILHKPTEVLSVINIDDNDK